MRKMTMPKKRCKDWVPGGRASGRCPEEFDADQVRRGIEVEMEHVEGGPYDAHTARMMAQDIALDHLSERGGERYYTELAKIHHDEPSGYKPNRRSSRIRVYDALEMAADIRATFQGKAAEQAVEFPFSWPRTIQHVGESLAVAYESDKWKKKRGDMEAYKHLAESKNHALCVPGLIHHYEDASESYPVVGPHVSLTSAPMPRHFAILGLFVEADLRLHTTGEDDDPGFGRSKDDGCVKLTVGHGMLGASKILWSKQDRGRKDQPFLFVYTESDGVLMIIVGKRLGIEKDGITG